MEWVESFYGKQYEWGGLLELGIAEHNHTQAALIKQLAGDGIKRILELGAGGGQTAAAVANMGHSIVTIDLIESAVKNARALAETVQSGDMTVIQGDFYNIELDGLFDVVCYWDGFGIGTDSDQKMLLTRVAGWLKPGGCALIDCSTPWYAASVVGKQWGVGKAIRRYDFDADQCRWLDKWWLAEHEAQAVTQSLRCYSPADLRLLLKGTGLSLDSVEPGGTVDWEKGEYIHKAPLGKAMYYTAKLLLETTDSL